MKNVLRGNRAVMVVSLAAALVMHCGLLDLAAAGILTEAGIFPYGLTFCGFYGCLFLWLAWDRKWLWLKILLTAVNAVIIGFFILMGFMGTVWGPLVLLLRMLIPLPWHRILG